jgi:SpoIID/LytB domain protein
VRLRIVVVAVAILTASGAWSGSNVALAWKPDPEAMCQVFAPGGRRSPGIPWFSLGRLCDLGAERRASDARLAEALPQSPLAAGIEIRIGVGRAGGGYSVTTLPLEAYVARVLAGEAGRDSRPAALEALAIAVRTYTLANRGRHRSEDFDLCDETHCQVMRTATAATERAAVATAGRVLTSGGAPASIYYSASCGGRTEIPSEVWPGADDPPYLPSRPDDGCGGAPLWSAELTGADLLRAFRAGGFNGPRLRDVLVAARNRSGRVSRLRLVGLKPEVISGQDLRVVVGRTLGWQFIKSTAFQIQRKDGRYKFTGHGSGHGVGMCVIGSMRLAVAGESADQILRRYYPGLAIGTPVVAPKLDEPRLVRRDSPGLAPPAGATSAPVTPSPATAAAITPPATVPPVTPPPPRIPAVAPSATPAAAAPSALPPAAASAVSDVLVSLPDGDEGERAFVTGVAVRARADLSRALGVPAPRVTLRFHPTADSYEQATKAPWFTSGAVVRGEIHLMPPTLLRARGVLERTVRHELVHVMTNAALEGRPLWIREGAALYFSGAPTSSGDPESRPIELPRTSCPADAELGRPVSVGALTNAYARAQSCFARELLKRQSWRDIK